MRSLFTRFEIIPSSEFTDPDVVVNDIAENCWQWVLRAPWVDDEGLPESWEEGEFKLNEHDALMVNDQTCERGRFWRMRRSEWGRDDKGIQYVNHIFIVRNGKRIEFSLLQEIVHQRQRIGPSEVRVFPPSIIRDVMGGHDCAMEGMEISRNWELVSSAKTRDFVFENILNPSRVMPIVLLSKRWDTRKAIIDRPGKLSNRLAGLARVYLLGDPGTKRFEADFGRQWVGNGTIRIYWPGTTSASISSDPAWGDMFTLRRFDEEFRSDEESLSQGIINRICERTSTLTASSPLVKGVRQRIEEERNSRIEKEEEEEREKILKKLKSIDEQASYYREENNRLERKSRSLETRLKHTEQLIEDQEDLEESLRFRISVLDDEKSGLRKEASTLKDLKSVLDEALFRNPEGGIDEFKAHVQSYYSDEEEPEPEPEFNSIKEAVEAAKRNLPRLRFLDTAIDSSGKTNSDADPAEVYEIFRTLNDELWEKIKIAMDKDLLAGKNRININDEIGNWLGGKFAERESNETMEMFGKELNPNGRMFPIGNGISIKMEPHIKLGSKSNPLRIHFVCLHPKSSYDAVERYRKKSGKLGKRKARKAVSHFPSILIGWCGEHLPTSSGK